MKLLGRDHSVRSATALAVAIATPSLAMQQALHGLRGAHEHGEPGPVLHLLRDAALLLPPMVLAMLVALAACRWCTRARSDAGAIAALATFVPIAGFLAALTFALGVPVHATLFEVHGGGEAPATLLDWLGHMGRDGMVTLAATMPAAFACSLVARAWPSARRARLDGRHPQRYRLAGAVGLLSLVASTTAMLAVHSSPAAAGLVGAPCPTGVPVRHFSVVALDVDITLNRFGDHDPLGKMYVLEDRVADVRAEEATGHVSIGLRDDPIQPLVIRADLGDCIDIDFRNATATNGLGMHVDGLSFSTATSSGDALGANPSSAVDAGQTRSYRFYLPDHPGLEGGHYIRPGIGNRGAVSHGLFGAIIAEPAGSTWVHPDNGGPIESGWAAIIRPPGKRAFREFARLFHEVGDENFQISDRTGNPLPMVDPHTEAYRPGSRAVNYRSEPFLHRLDKAPHEKSLAYNSYTFGDPATPFMRSYLGEPTKIRLMHVGGEMFHVYHLHGGGIRWRANPVSDHTFSYEHTGLDKVPATALAPSERLDSQAMAPGEAFNLEIEGGAGGVQQTVGDLLEHCHIAEHYNSGMWEFWRVFNTRQTDLQPLPDMPAAPTAVDSAGLLGRTMADGTRLTAANVGSWIAAMLPPKGVPKDDQDASVWDWKLDTSNPTQPVALGEPRDTSNWPDLVDTGEPDMPGDVLVGSRPKIRFNPVDGRPAFPLLRPHVGQRAPFSPRHSGTPFLGASVNAARTGTGPDPYARRPDGLCPAGAPSRLFEMSTIELPIQVSRAGDIDPTGEIFALDKDKAAIRAGTKPAQPLAIRANLGDCVNVNLASETTDLAAFDGFAKSNIHIHHVQFDIQGSDGASTGFVFDQSIRPYRIVDPKLTSSASVGTRVLRLSSTAKFQPGVWVGVGIGQEGLEVRQVASVAATSITLTEGIARSRAAGTYVGTEFARYQWYPDTELDNVFWHDHVDGIHGWGKGLVGQLVVEPKGSTYHDPVSGAPVDSGTIVDVHTTNPLVPGLVDGSFRELALWTIDDNPATDSTLNLRAEPWADRLANNPDRSLLFSSYVHGDPYTPLPRAYAGDPFVIRTINVAGNGVDTLHVDGHETQTELRQRDSGGRASSSTTDTVHYGVSERYSLVLNGGAGGAARRAGDYLYMNGIGRRFRQGAWGLIRVFDKQVASLRPLPGYPVAGTSPPLPAVTGQRPPEPATPGSPCPASAPIHTFDVTAIDLDGRAQRGPAIRAAYVPTSDVTAVQAGNRTVEPLVLHVAEGECLAVTLRNGRTAPGSGGPVPRVSFHVSELQRTPESSGIDIGFGPEQTVAGGAARTYSYYAQSDKVGGALITDMGDIDGLAPGLFGMVVVSPAGTTFHDQFSGANRDVGSQVVVQYPGGDAYRDASLIIHDEDPQIGENSAPYKSDANARSSIQYGSAGVLADRPGGFATTGDAGPGTPILQAVAHDPMRVHVAVSSGSEQAHVFSLGGLPWARDPYLPGANLVTAQGLGPWEEYDMELLGGAGGLTGETGDFGYGDLRRPFADAGLWGLLRVHGDGSCGPLLPLPGRDCSGTTTP